MSIWWIVHVIQLFTVIVSFSFVRLSTFIVKKVCQSWFWNLSSQKSEANTSNLNILWMTFVCHIFWHFDVVKRFVCVKPDTRFSFTVFLYGVQAHCTRYLSALCCGSASTLNEWMCFTLSTCRKLRAQNVRMVVRQLKTRTTHSSLILHTSYFIHFSFSRYVLHTLDH